MKYFYSTIQAFTLIELLVVLSLFSGVMTLSLGSLLNVRAINNRLQEKEAIMDNLNFSMQIITRDIRFGSSFYCASALPDQSAIPRTRKNCDYSTVGGSSLIFKSSDAFSSQDRVAYYLKNGIFYKDEYIGGSTTTLQMTADDVNIKSLTFFVQGALSSDPADGLNEGGGYDYAQPFITIIVSGRARATNSSATATTTDFNIQTSVSPRILDSR